MAQLLAKQATNLTTNSNTILSLCDVAGSFEIIETLFNLLAKGNTFLYNIVTGIRVLANGNLRTLHNTFNLKALRFPINGNAVYNSYAGCTVVSQGNVSYPNTLTGFSNPATVITLTTF
jgi:hypothetical protein